MKTILLLPSLIFAAFFIQTAQIQAENLAVLQNCQRTCSPQCADLARRAKRLALSVEQNCGGNQNTPPGGGPHGGGAPAGVGSCILEIQNACNSENLTNCFPWASEKCSNKPQHYGRCVGKLTRACKADKRIGCTANAVSECEGQPPRYANCVEDTTRACILDNRTNCYNYAARICKGN